ncbi:hypothetical protein LINGRAHAP2_LOCUS12764 [Linum grandiflorum]
MVDRRSKGGKFLVSMAISLMVLTVAFSSETSMAQRVVHLSKLGEQQEAMNREEILRESKISASGSSSHVSHHGNHRRGNDGGR